MEVLTFPSVSLHFASEKVSRGDQWCRRKGVGHFSRMSFEFCEHRAMPGATGRPPPLLQARSQVITRSCFDGELPLSWRNLESHEVVPSGAVSPFIQVRWQVYDDL